MSVASTTDNEASNDIMIVDINDGLQLDLGDITGKPLMMLFLRLIGNDNKQNTVLTNAQIVDILQKEFGMDIIYTHELEIEVYLNLLKRFLKDWPQWDEFDFAINTLKDQKNVTKMKVMLETNYKSLRAYLKHMLDVVEPLLKKVVAEVVESTVKEPTYTNDEVALVVRCTRLQLNQLFFRRPHPEQNLSILNIDAGPSKIRVKPISLESILNWPSIQISISLNGVLYKREVKHVSSHLLVNKKLNYAQIPPKLLNTNFQMKAPKITGLVETENFLYIIDRIKKTKMIATQNNQLDDDVKLVCDVLTNDLKEAPKYMQSPASYRQNLSRYPYVRYFYEEVNTDKFSLNNYDLQLEETAIPQVVFHFLRFNNWESEQNIPSDGSFLKVECLLCECLFTGCNMFSYLQQHFDFHCGEMDWTCSNCRMVISMEHLAENRWQHECLMLKRLLEKQAEVRRQLTTD